MFHIFIIKYNMKKNLLILLQKERKKTYEIKTFLFVEKFRFFSFDFFRLRFRKGRNTETNRNSFTLIFITRDTYLFF